MHKAGVPPGKFFRPYALQSPIRRSTRCLSISKHRGTGRAGPSSTEQAPNQAFSWRYYAAKKGSHLHLAFLQTVERRLASHNGALVIEL
jgi:hypothetical protein